MPEKDPFSPLVLRKQLDRAIEDWGDRYPRLGFVHELNLIIQPFLDHIAEESAGNHPVDFFSFAKTLETSAQELLDSITKHIQDENTPQGSRVLRFAFEEAIDMAKSSSRAKERYHSLAYAFERVNCEFEAEQSRCVRLVLIGDDLLKGDQAQIAERPFREATARLAGITGDKVTTEVDRRVRRAPLGLGASLFLQGRFEEASQCVTVGLERCPEALAFPSDIINLPGYDARLDELTMQCRTPIGLKSGSLHFLRAYIAFFDHDSRDALHEALEAVRYRDPQNRALRIMDCFLEARLGEIESLSINRLQEHLSDRQLLEEIANMLGDGVEGVATSDKKSKANDTFSSSSMITWLMSYMCIPRAEALNLANHLAAAGLVTSSSANFSVLDDSTLWSVSRDTSEITMEGHMHKKGSIRMNSYNFVLCGPRLSYFKSPEDQAAGKVRNTIDLRTAVLRQLPYLKGAKGPAFEIVSIRADKDTWQLVCSTQASYEEWVEAIKAQTGQKIV